MNHVNPDDAKLVTSDIGNFWRAYDLSEGKSTKEKIEIFETEYLSKGSTGLKDFIEARIETAEKLVEAVEAMPKYYASARKSSYRVPEMTDQIRQFMFKWKSLYADAVFADVYFMIGRMITGGTTSGNGLLIGTEMYCRTDDLPDDELSTWHLQVLTSIEHIPVIVMHELMHIQQSYMNKNVTALSHSVFEGAADFLGELVCGRHINPHLHEYGQEHETELWNAFSKELDQEDIGNWLYNGWKTNREKPADLGYYMGYRICESYYEKMADKKQAIRDILAIKDATDAHRFLKESGYGQ